MNKDEEYVRSVWKRVVSGPYHGMATHHFVALDLVKAFVDFNPNSGECWSAAAEFTRERMEEVRQLRNEIDSLGFFNGLEHRDIISYARTGQDMDSEDLIAAVKETHRWSRILARLDTELTRLTAGMKPEAL